MSETVIALMAVFDIWIFFPETFLERVVQFLIEGKGHFTVRNALLGGRGAYFNNWGRSFKIIYGLEGGGCSTPTTGNSSLLHNFSLAFHKFFKDVNSYRSYTARLWNGLAALENAFL